MSKPTRAASGTNVPAGETKDPFRATIEIATGPNVDGEDHLVRAAHQPPDPAIVDDTGEFDDNAPHTEG